MHKNPHVLEDCGKLLLLNTYGFGCWVNGNSYAKSYRCTSLVLRLKWYIM